MPAYFVLPTVSACLRSEAMAVQHNAFQKGFALCSFLEHNFSFSGYLWMCFVHLMSGIERVTLTSDLNCPLEPVCLRSKLYPKCSWNIYSIHSHWHLTEYIRRYADVVCGVPSRKDSLDIHWCVLDLAISGANCCAGKFGCRCSAVLLKRDMHAQTNSDSYNDKHTNKYACSLIILDPSAEERLLIGSSTTWKITHSRDPVLKRQSPYSSWSQSQTFRGEITFYSEHCVKSDKNGF